MEKMKIGSITTLAIVAISVILVVVVLLFLLRGDEDDWIRNSDTNGVWTKHGNPSTIPVYVVEQKDALNCATDLYNQARNNEMIFDSQCLGACGNYSVDIVHSPRNMDDDKTINQCPDYPKKTRFFIELDSSGNIVRVA